MNLRAGDQVIGESNLGKDVREDQILHFPTLKKRCHTEGGTLDCFWSDASIKVLCPDKDYTREKSVLRPRFTVRARQD